MASTNSPNPSSTETVDLTTPLFAAAADDRNRRTIPRQSLRVAAQFIRRAGSRQMMREPSMVVRESAAEQLEERQSDWAYSKPVVILDIIWNLAFVVVAAAVLVLSRDESPSMPLRLWIIGYAMQCGVHVVCVCVEFRRRQRLSLPESVVEDGNGGGENQGSSHGEELEDSGIRRVDEETTSIAKHLESVNTMFSFIWWVIGFYWVSAGGQALARQAFQLYWLCIIYLAFDVFFVVFCVALACVIAIAVCCCLPCIIALLYAVADQQEGASKEDIEQLTKYKFRRSGDIDKLFRGTMTECGTDTPIEHAVLPEDAECCICISPYEDGVELRELPCGHHFHCACVDKWLHINAICPLCKYKILKPISHGMDQV